MSWPPGAKAKALIQGTKSRGSFQGKQLILNLGARVALEKPNHDHLQIVNMPPFAEQDSPVFPALSPPHFVATSEIPAIVGRDGQLGIGCVKKLLLIGGTSVARLSCC